MKTLPLIVTLLVVIGSSIFASISKLTPMQMQIIKTKHGLVLPDSAKNIQNSGNEDLDVPDRGIVTLCEVSAMDLKRFLKELKITDRKQPIKKAGSPTINGWNVWPKNAKTFVPGNEEYSNLKKNWEGEASPEYMLSCTSPVGDWLHVEVWTLNNGNALLKLYTDWN